MCEQGTAHLVTMCAYTIHLQARTPSLRIMDPRQCQKLLYRCGLACRRTLAVSSGCPTTMPATPPSVPAVKSFTTAHDPLVSVICSDTGAVFAVGATSVPVLAATTGRRKHGHPLFRAGGGAL